MEEMAGRSPVPAAEGRVLVWTLVLTTSAGWVMMEAARPAATPQEKRREGASVSELVALMASCLAWV
jgi:hypothetical protein